MSWCDYINCQDVISKVVGKDTIKKLGVCIPGFEGYSGIKCYSNTLRGALGYFPLVHTSIFDFVIVVLVANAINGIFKSGDFKGLPAWKVTLGSATAITLFDAFSEGGHLIPASSSGKVGEDKKGLAGSGTENGQTKFTAPHPML